METVSLLDALYPAGAAGIPASVPRVNNPADFINTYGGAAETAGKALGVDPKILLGQWGLETGWGKSIIPGTNNLGNIKDFSGAGTAATDNMTGSRDKYRAYATPADFANDYASLIQRKYPGALGAGSDPAKFAAGLKGYAEDPQYANKLVQASRMASNAPGPVMNALGKAVSSLIPSANAQPLQQPMQRAPMPQNDDIPPELAGLVNNYRQQPGQQAPAPSADPLDQLVTQFKQQPAAPKQAQQGPAQLAGAAQTSNPTQPQQGDRLGAIARAGMAAPGFGALINAINPVTAENKMVKGLASGFADVGNTIINSGTKAGTDLLSGINDPNGLIDPKFKRPGGVSSLVTGQQPMSRVEQANAERAASLAQFNKDNASLPFTVGRIGGNIAATAPVGGVIGGAFKGAAAVPGFARFAPALNAVGDAISTGGMSTGLAPTSLAGQVGNMALRMVGGAVNGGASAGLIDPESAKTGAVIGATIPPVIAGVGKIGSLAAAGIRALRTPDEVRAAKAILDAGGLTNPQEIAAVRAAVGQMGPNIVAEGPTVPQILQNPGVSQLARTMQNSGGTDLLNKEAAQNASRLATLDRVSPVNGTVQQSAENFGNGLAANVVPAEAQASGRVRAAFDAVDPFNETRFNLPIDQMQAAKDKFIGPGTFGTGSKVDQALGEARRIGLEEIPAVVPVSAPGARSQPQNIAQAIRQLGGINTGAVSSRGMAGELADLRQSGLGSVMQNGRGQSLDTLAQAAHAQGFISEPDPALLLNALRDHAAGQRVVSNAADQTGAMQAAREAAMGQAPGATVLPKAVAFREMQNMRSSLGEAAQQAADKGANKEAAALRQMITDLDNQTAQVAAGRGAAGEYFPSDIVKAWQDAVAMHADKMDKFHTGPQASMFRNGGDGLPQAQGAELAPKFFNPRLSQSSDIASFQKIATPETTAALKNYAVTDAASQTDRLGNLTNAKFNNWLKARSGAIDGLMTPGEQAQLRGVGADVARADAATSLGMAKGSPTVQNALSLGALDNKMLAAFAKRAPFIGHFTGPMLQALQNTARAGKVAQIGGLLADPAAFDTALAQYLSQSSRGPIGVLDPAWLGLSRTLPVLPAGSGHQ